MSGILDGISYGSNEYSGSNDQELINFLARKYSDCSDSGKIPAKELAEADALVLKLKNVNLTVRGEKDKHLVGYIFRNRDLKDRTEDDKLGSHLMKRGLDLKTISAKQVFRSFLADENFNWAIFFLHHGFQINDPSYDFLLGGCLRSDNCEEGLSHPRTRFLLENGFDDRVIMKGDSPEVYLFSEISTKGRTILEFIVRLPHEVESLPWERQQRHADDVNDSLKFFENYKKVKADFLKTKGIVVTERNEGPNHLDFSMEEKHLRFVLKKDIPDPTVEREKDMTSSIDKDKKRCIIA